MLTRLAALLLCMMIWLAPVQAATLLVVGDSISAGFGVEIEQGWVALLDKRLKERQLDVSVVNASISGDTSAGALARLPALLDAHKPKWLVLEIGGNDGLRGQPPAQLQANLQRIVELSQAAGAQVVLLGMQIPPNYGPIYNQAFVATFKQVAEANQLPWMPFFLEGVGGNNALMQGDGIHPNAQAQPLLLDNAWSVLAPLLDVAKP
ncbi:arylesterase [Atopomonas sediminilitoris]|uniref:arylesterase n=1 Tax=Atopomonas sediminilitoris TaxID=2919919 RepID=UPI002342C447|nr:arylesterase [Atopomonas sediminilitoris]